MDSNNPTAAAVDSEAAKARAEAAEAETKLTCDVLCSLSSAPLVKSTGTATAAPAQAPPPPHMASYQQLQQNYESIVTENNSNSQRKSSKPACPKAHQLPMFLSKTYHMIDRCNPDISTWAESGDSFVVKNVDKFSSEVLPMYFKHSNFSSFARQLNFYGFRKLRSDPILTSDVDPNTVNYIRFYHSKFQRDRPDLLHQIKRATKSEQQSKDDVDSLRAEVSKLKECVQQVSTDMERKMADMSFDYNRRIANLSGEYDKLAHLVTQLLQQHHHQAAAPGAPPPPPFILHAAPHLAPHAAPHAAHHAAHHPVPSYVTTHAPHGPAPAAEAEVAAVNYHSAAAAPPAEPVSATEKMGSLSHAVALRLEQQQQAAQPAVAAPAPAAEAVHSGEKRPAPEGEHKEGAPALSKPKLD